MRIKVLVVALFAVVGFGVGATAASASTCVGSGLGPNAVEVCTP